MISMAAHSRWRLANRGFWLWLQWFRRAEKPSLLVGSLWLLSSAFGKVRCVHRQVREHCKVLGDQLPLGTLRAVS